ncbi:acyl-CoA thioesterase [Gordonia sp. NPDC003376]
MKQLTRSLSDVFALIPNGDGTWHAHVDPTWRSWTGPHGGVITALATEVAQRELPEVAVRTVEIRFLGRPDDGDLVLRPRIHPLGRRTTIADVDVTQGDHLVARASVTLGHLGDPHPDDRIPSTPLTVRNAEDCDRFLVPPDLLPMGQHLDVRPTDGPLPITGSDEAWMRMWLSTIPELPVDAASLAIFVDAPPPGLFPTLTAPVAIPTVTLSMTITADLRDVDTTRVLVHTANTSSIGGWAVDDTEVRDRHGLLLATARQSRRVVRPRA